MAVHAPRAHRTWPPTGGTSATASTPSREVPADRWDERLLRPDLRPAPTASTAGAAASSTTCSFDPVALRHHARGRRRRRARPAARPPGRRRPRPTTPAASAPTGSTPTGRRDPRPGRLPRPPAWPASTSGCASPTSCSTCCASSCPTSTTTSSAAVDDAFQARLGPVRPGGRDRPGPEPGRVAHRQPARPPRPGVHRSTPPAPARSSPSTRRCRELRDGPLRRGARRRRAPLPRRHLLERLHPARRAQPGRARSGPSTGPPTASSSARAPAWSC